MEPTTIYFNGRDYVPVRMGLIVVNYLFKDMNIYD